MVNKQRLGDIFESLVKIDSESRDEAQICMELKRIFEEMGAEVSVDNAGEAVGGNTGNLLARFKGNREADPIFLSGHMDTVMPGKGIKPILKDGVYRSDGTTILGSDDKSAIAIIIEVLRVIMENDLPYGPLEIVLTICEEVGLLGAKNFDTGVLESKFGYILDSTDIDGIVTRAPNANRLEFKVRGKSAHAGAEPEKGINAISVASRAIAGLELGRIDHETTCNIGIIEGGKAENIVPDLVTVRGEVRSHSSETLDLITGRMVRAFEEAVESTPEVKGDKPALDVSVRTDYKATVIPEDHIAVTLARKASENLGRKLESKTIGGGADANIFFEKGIVSGVLGTGMTACHTLEESIKLDDMVSLTEHILEIIRIHSGGK